MKKHLLVILGVLATATFAIAQEGAASADEKPAAEATPDVLKEAVDPYNPVGEQRKFFAASGVDNELTAEEFATDQSKTNGYVRKFDKWAAMVTYDRYGNKKVSWFESDAYRRAI